MAIAQNKSKSQFHLALAAFVLLILGLVLYLAREIPVVSGIYTVYLMTLPISILAVSCIGISSIISGRRSYKLYHDKYSKWTLCLGLIISAIAVSGGAILAGVIIWGLGIG